MATIATAQTFCTRVCDTLTAKKATEEAKTAVLTELQAIVEGPEFVVYEPLIVQQVLPALAEAFDMKAGDAKKLLKKVANALIDNVNKHAVGLTVQALFKGMTEEAKWKVKEASCNLLARLAKKAKKKLSPSVPEIIRLLPLLVLDMKKEVSDAARDALAQCVDVIDNRDIKPAVGPITNALEKPEEVAETIQTLASVKFVQTVDDATLGVVAPLLLRGFSVPKTATKRQCAVIINNMSKLVENPTDAAPFLPTLLPALERASSEISDPEAREVADKARLQLEKIRHNLEVHLAKHPDTPADLRKLLTEQLGGAERCDKPEVAPYVEYAAYTAAHLNHDKKYKAELWQANVGAVLAPAVGAAEAEKAALAALASMEKTVSYNDEEADDDVGEELCNCRFSLAYGTKILLHNADLKLKKGRLYGLLGPNDCGKTSLMRAMANGELDGFPTDLRTVFVEADILGDLSHLSCIEYVFADPAIQRCGVDKPAIAKMLTTVGFSDFMLGNDVSTLSGGWRMKLALARAMLQKAEVLLMDEPTNHLDVINVAWVKEYLNNLKDVSVIAVSHDAGLLEDCMTDIIQFNGLKLAQYHGNLSKFVEKHPEAKSFFNLRESKVVFKIPNPSFLDGVKSRGKALIKMTDCAMQYPKNDKPTVSGVTVQVSLGSRVACIGRNGAGKSTVIKMLTGEMAPTSGVVWSYPGLKMAYVAQHAFHHIEKHLDKTPNEYIRWRYEYGEDREAIEKSTVKLSDEDLALMAKPVTWEYEDEKGNLKKDKRVIKEMTGARRDDKKGRAFEYELVWQASGAKQWVHADLMIEWGWAKQLKSIDAKVEAREGMYRRALTQDNVEVHLEDVGLDREFGTHMRIGQLSGGQKVKVVLGAATWNQPHIMILDEPTNYLDRESLGGLVKAIEQYEGGVVIISHNDEFCSTLCPETWLVEDGKLNLKGDADWMKKMAKESVDMVQLDEVVDALGNKTKVKAPTKKDLSKKDKKKADKVRKAKLDRGEELSDDE